MKGFYKDSPVRIQFLLLVTFILIGLTFIFLGILFLKICGLSFDNITGDSFYANHISQFFSSLLIFLFPAVGTSYLCSRNPGEFLFFKKITDIRIFILTLLIVIFISPAIDVLSHFNSKMQLPEFMSQIEDIMRKAEDLAREAVLVLLSKEGIIPLFVNFFVIAVVAGITEEFFFRGALFSIIGRKIKNPHVVIWIIAFIFSAIHFQFYGFIPRMLLGALMGYLLYWTGSIWVPVFAHFLNNAIGVISATSMSDEEFLKMYNSIESEIAPEYMMQAILSAIIGLFLFAFCVIVMKRITSKRVTA